MNGRGVLKGTLWSVLLLAMQGCMTVQPYPVCYFADKPSPEEAKTLEDGWDRAAVAYLGPGADPVLSGDGRWLFAQGVESNHARLRAIWPRLGCIGNYASGITYPYYAHCLELEQAMLDSRDYLLRGTNSDFLDGYLGYCNGSLSNRRKKAGLAPLE